ncbi:endolytic transglycosylase MltG [Catellatospora tritici]|uniref:endolytic transglycosylase MltG n=1 Tax=Catellatospora tritici TaxID=2851566 RepID=UPI001C2CFAA4|nr:endolytic transglycosylase MltG [Catellatospora tritici]MBV1850382.1 endolytic transglycosylase MltG [Catellatospora tritici]
MIDELDLAFDDDHNGDGTRQGRRKQRKRRRRSLRHTLLAMGMTVLLLIGLGLGAWFGYAKVRDAFVTPDYSTSAHGRAVSVVVRAGDTTADIARALTEADVVKSEKAFVEAGARNPDALRIQPGHYTLRTHMSADDALKMMLDPKNRVVNGVTIPEGLSTFRVYELLAQKTKIPAEKFAEAAKDPVALGVPEWWFNRSDKKHYPPSVEGFLFPETYDFAPDADAETILRTMVNHFLTVTGELHYAEQVQSELGGITPYEALIVASLAQAEAGNADDLGKVARVAYNRVYKRTEDLTCACFQFDVTVNYARELKGKDPKASKDFSVEELNDPKNPYGRNAEGMIPTPINNPGKAALEGAMAPPKGDWYYFVAVDRAGHSAFSKTFEQFCEDNDKAVKNGVLKHSSC